MAQLVEIFQQKIRSSSSGFVLGLLRLGSGAILGLTFALVGDEIVKYGVLSFLFVIVSVTYAFMKLSKSWRIGGVLVFDLVCVLMGMLLRLYILMAPG